MSSVTLTEGSHASILQELLLALLGYDGDVFVESRGERAEKGGKSVPEPWSIGLNVSTEMDWITAPDREGLNSLVALGFHFKVLQDYVEQETSLLPGQRQSSLIRRAIATGLSELLDVYRAAILRMQQQLRRMPSVSMASLNFSLQEFKMLLPALHRMVYQAERDKLSGAQLLRMVHDKSSCGVPALQSCCQRLLWHCNQILLSHVRSWVVHGVLLGGREDFFIQTALPEQDISSAAPKDDEAGAVEWQQGFKVARDALPPYISKDTAESILFIGKAVRVLKQSASSRRPSGEMSALLSMITESWTKELRQIQSSALFHRLDLERVISSMQTQVAAHLWDLVSVKAQLVQHLRALKDYFLLARGDFFQGFLSEAEPLLQLPPRLATADAVLAHAFQLAGSSSSAEEDPLFPNVHVHLDDEPPKPDSPSPGSTPVHQGALGSHDLHVPSYDAWDGLSLTYDVKWPLHILLTPEVLAKYNALFQHLLRLKRVNAELDAAWASLRRQAGAESLQSRQPIWDVRLHMAHLLLNLQVYMQVDVVEAQSAAMFERLGKASDFGDAESAHTAFIAALLEQTMLTSPRVADSLTTIYALCTCLCSLAQKAEEAMYAGERMPALRTEAILLGADFRGRASSLFRLLHSDALQGGPRGAQLRQLLLRLNFNHFLDDTQKPAAEAAEQRYGDVEG
ncbi:g9995 [Coccomyxa viridis]|uniref:Gamma-tubulin complex component n=1 Tax=Coccomyxa viridis TaxID=1274662 RepID=A0ABP1G4N4_9CHLO